MRRVGAPGGTASVACFFVSRIDTLVDRALEELGGEEALALRGRVAVASARLAYRHFTKHMASPAFVELSARGGRMQRLLWGSTGTRNEAYSDVKYVEELSANIPSIRCRRPHSRPSWITAWWKRRCCWMH